MENPMRVAMFQMDIVWKDVNANLKKLKSWLVSHKGEADLVVVPEMFSTGFCVDALDLSEDSRLQTISQLQNWSDETDIAIVGSLMYAENGTHYNRAFFIAPHQSPVYYDKHHLFRMGSEGVYFSSGEKRVIVEYKGWRFLMQVCYDLRFPVFSRIRNNDYDVILYVACWPQSRVGAWNILLPARAVENLCYVCGVNASGVDDAGRTQAGHSTLIDMKGEILSQLDDNEEDSIVELSKEKLEKFRTKFPVWKDADEFNLK